MTWNQAYDIYKEEPLADNPPKPTAMPTSPVLKVMPAAGSTSRNRVFVIGSAIVAVFALLGWFFMPRQTTVVDQSAVAALDQRLTELTKRVEQLERLGQGVVKMSEALDRIDQRGTQLDEIFTRIEDQNRRSDKFIARVDALESAMIERLMDINVRLEDGQKPASHPQPPARAEAPPVSSSPPVQAAVAAPRATPASVEVKPKVRTHTVQAGDTLHSIARRYGLTVSMLRRLNQLPANPALRSGQRLIISRS